MASPSVLLSTSVSVLVYLSTSFSTIYHTSNPVTITSLTSAATHLTTLTLPETVMASTLAIPTTITQTISNIFTSYAPGAPATNTPPPPAVSSETITSTSTVTSTVVQAGQTMTYYPPTHTFVLTPPPTYTVVEPTSTITLTEIVLLLEDPSGQVYTTITTALPARASQTGPIVFVAGDDQDDGWNSWSDAQKGGLIAGVVLLFLLLLGILAFCLLRRRNIWLANEWAGAPAPVVVQPHMAGAVMPYQQQQQQAQWGYGPAGWGIRN
ncbi:hypothetical protein LTR70_001744 [Exophiala xenobiotica]|uniref:Uncharacterized protein n=1 Tax=Lithohypha guttulata TaxID=1690604 RepID=A0ABR0KM52_9EURO|nr:hypothetical protein LTR24_001063 [Lithohypha guttulata]KAK5327002.1 hypothetical protein LTR70_001744 [Exophiala xenobiotica]